MGHRTRALLLAAGLVGAVAGALPGGVEAADPSVVGEWSAPFAEVPLFAQRPPRTPEEAKMTPPAVTMAVLPDGRVLYGGGLTGLEDVNPGVTLDAGRVGKPSPTRVLDLRSGTPQWSTPEPETTGADDIFCGDVRILPDGRVMIAGGTIWKSDPVDLSPYTGPGGPLHPVTGDGFGGTADVWGTNASRIFDPATNQWDYPREGDESKRLRMHHGRWYPTMLTLPDGKLFIAGGVEKLVYNTKGLNVQETETFDPATGMWTENPPSANISLPLFARMHLLPDGRIFYTGTGQMWSPAGEAVDEAVWNLHKMYDPERQEWVVTGVGSVGARSSVFSVMMMLEPARFSPNDPDPNRRGKIIFPISYDRAKILIGGGTVGVSPSTYVATNLVEIIQAGPGPKSASVKDPLPAQLNKRRWFSSGVLLPDGTILALSGGDKDEVIQPGSEAAVREAELYDPARNTWTLLAPGQRDRTYHNSAVLLPDGSVLVGGHSPINNGYGKADNTTHDAGLTANNYKDPSFEIFRPPYLFRGPRPTITRAPAGIAYGGGDPVNGTFDIEVPGAAGVKKVVLIRLPSTTHVTDADMRGLELFFRVTGPSTLRVVAPPNGAAAPPGYYYLFVLKSTPKGLTPSKARVVHVGPEAIPGDAPAPFGA